MYVAFIFTFFFFSKQTSSKIAVTSKTPGRTQRVNIFAFREAKKAGRVVAMVVFFSFFYFFQRVNFLAFREAKKAGRVVAMVVFWCMI